MKALILAAGQGARLRPLTDDRPKCLVELGGVPLLLRQAAALAEAGLDDLTVIAGYRHEQIQELGMQVLLNPRFEDTNMVYTLFCAREAFAGDQDVVVSYGDIVCEPRVVCELLASPAPVAVVVDREWRRVWELRNEDPLADAETLKLSPEGRILELGKKPRGFEDIQAQYIGLFKVRNDWCARFVAAYEALDRAATYDGKPFERMFMTSFLQHLIDSGWPVVAVPVDNGWLEVDTVEDLEVYHRLLSEGRLGEYYAPFPGGLPVG